MLIFLLSTASQWPSGQVLMLGEQVEKFLVIPTTHSRLVTTTWSDHDQKGGTSQANSVPSEGAN